jgi:hypothetical protein
MDKLFFEPAVQYGAFGLCVLLVGIIFWTIRQQSIDRRESEERLVKLLEDNQRVISAMTAALQENTRLASDQIRLSREMNNKLISRPCIARGEQQA